MDHRKATEAILKIHEHVSESDVSIVMRLTLAIFTAATRLLARQDVQPIHGNALLSCYRYRFSVHEKRQIAVELASQFVDIITQIYATEVSIQTAGKGPAAAVALL